MAGVVLVSGATGSVGRHVVDGLLARGCAVRALTRRPETAGLPAGVEVVGGDLSDREAVSVAAEGADRMFLFPAPDLDAGLAAARSAGVEHVVVLSSLAVLEEVPDASTRMHRAVEDAVVASGLAHTFVRPGAFMTNDLAWAREIRAAGTLSTAYPDASMAPVAEQDIARVAVAALVDPAAVPATVEMTGPESLSIRARAAAIATVTGGSIEVVELTPEQAREQMAQVMGADAIDIILGHLAAAPTVALTVPAPATTLGRAATTYRDWVAGHRAAFGDN